MIRASAEQKTMLKLFGTPPGLTCRTGLVPKGRTCKKNMHIIFYDYADALAIDRWVQ